MYQGMDLNNSRWLVVGLPETYFPFLGLVTLVSNAFVVNRVSLFIATICQVELGSSQLNISVTKQRITS